MKNILFILITIPLIFNSCKKEDDSPNSGNNNTSSSILGTWKFSGGENSSISGYIDLVLGTEIITDTYSEIWSTDTLGQQTYMVFRYDSTCSEYSYYLDTLQYSSDYSYVKEGNMMSLNIDTENIINCQITTLTDNNLSFSWGENGNHTWNDTTYFSNSNNIRHCIKSDLPSITIEPLNKKNLISGYNSFLNRRENR